MVWLPSGVSKVQSYVIAPSPTTGKSLAKVDVVQIQSSWYDAPPGVWIWEEEKPQEETDTILDTKYIYASPTNEITYLADLVPQTRVTPVAVISRRWWVHAGCLGLRGSKKRNS